MYKTYLSQIMTFIGAISGRKSPYIYDWVDPVLDGVVNYDFHFASYIYLSK